MDLNLLNTFMKVYELQSYTKAAEHFNISQAAVSMRIKQLEADIANTLFIRKGRSIEPTAHANYMMTKLAPASDLVYEALFKVGHKIYAPDLLVYDLANLDIDVFTPPLNQEQIFTDIRNRKVDLVLDFVTINDPSVVSEKVSEEEVMVAVRQDHPRIVDSITEQEFYNERHVSINVRREKSNLFMLLSDAPKPRDIAHEATSLVSQLAYVAHTDAISITPKRLAAIATKLGVKLLACPMKMNKAPISMLYHRSFLHNDEHIKLRQKVKNKISLRN
ncbi:LysR family transcriptional regulator [Shewanella sp. 3_MG-2023]|uniref:LysR family transcriptional regulator n=1 Tax=Shewanella sp. 3_MG-2023 TaxID=3062635 RepID=UPI0026E3D7CD|nr:LysR family transcriptional regulator [Shewanella sp. 3_MG-2023]MDO6774083.1 LysR family transcriptional regulator [Shewanella sp. 3_MG-2023]